MHLVLVIICYFYVVSVTIDEAKTNTPLVVNRNGILPLPIPLQFVKPITGRNLQIVQYGRQVNIFQFSQCPLPDFWWKPL